MLAIAKASFRGLLRSPNTVVFNVLFPVVFIAIFSVFDSKTSFQWKVAFAPDADSTSAIYQALKSVSVFRWETMSAEEQLIALRKGSIKAVIHVQSAPEAPAVVSITTSTLTTQADLNTLQLMLETAIHQVDRAVFPEQQTVATLNSDVQVLEGKPYRMIDFILPGQLGITLLASSVFGVAFLFFHMRQTLVLKRFFATPVKRLYIILGEALSRVILQLGITTILIVAAWLYLNFTLTNGWISLLEILAVCFPGVLIFMGMGFIVSGLAKSESVIPPLANIFTLPQFVFSGAFVKIDVFPLWLQTICELLPLTQMNNAMRKIAYEGAHLTACGKELLILSIWLIVIYLLAARLFKWE